MIKAMLEHLPDVTAWLPQHLLMLLLPPGDWFYDAFCCLRHPGHQIPAGAVLADEQSSAGGYLACRAAKLGSRAAAGLLYGTQLRTT